MKQTTVISSSANEHYKFLISLTTSKGINKQQQMILSGEKLVNEYLSTNSPADLRLQSVVDFDEVRLEKLNKKYDLSNTKKTILSKELFLPLDILGTHNSLLILQCPPIEEKKINLKLRGVELVAPLSDPRNLGSLVRTALGFSVDEIILTRESANPFLPQAVKASSGAVLKQKFSYTDLQLNQILFSKTDYALDLEGKNIIDVSWPKNFRLILGEEGLGLNLTLEQKKQLNLINIPTANIESLNATVSASIALWEYFKQK